MKIAILAGLSANEYGLVANKCDIEPIEYFLR
jgi:hypothetical protein